MTERDDWKSATTKLGELCVTTSGTQPMLEWPASNWATLELVCLVLDHF